MSKRVLFNSSEIFPDADLTKIGVYAQEALDAARADAIGYPAHWAAFTVAKTSAQEVTVSPGRYYEADKSFSSEVDEVINLQVHFPLAASDERWIALVLRGVEDTLSEDRLFETSTDIETSVPVTQTAPKAKSRYVEVVTQLGAAVPPPAAKPVIAETDACIAFVLTTSQGIQEIVPGEDYRVKSLHEVENRLVIVEADLNALRDRTESIETDITNISARLSDIPRPEIIEQIQRDIGAARLQLDLPDEARAWLFDLALTGDNWDETHPDWYALREEGIRFPSANQGDTQLSLLNAADPQIKLRNNRMLPAWTEVTRIQNLPTGEDSVNISQLTHSVVNAIKKEVSRERITYGPTYRRCENARGWGNLRNRQPGEMFTINGEEFQAVEIVGNHGWVGHRIYDVRRVRRDRYTETYWEYETTEVGLNGSIYGESILCSQPMIATSIEINLQSVGASGDIHLLLCEADETAVPRLEKVIANVTLPHADLKLGWNKFDLDLSLLDSGKRYGFFTVTTGNHAARTSSGNQYTGGSMFQISDGAYAQGDLTRDLAFRLNAAKFTSPRTEIEFDPLTLENGMTEIDLLYKGWVPGGTQLEWMYQTDGGEWILMDNNDGSGLNGLPALVRLKAIMIGTADLQPMIVMDSKARARTRRPANNFRATTVDHDFGISTSTIKTITVLDHFDEAYHTFDGTIIAGGSTLTPDTTTIEIDPDRPERRTVRCTYALAAPVTSAILRPAGATTNTVKTYHIESDNIIAI